LIITGLVVVFSVLAILFVQRFLYATIEINLPENTSAAIIKVGSVESDTIWTSNEKKNHSVRVPKGSYYVNFNTDNQYSQYYSSVGYREKKSYTPVFKAYQETLPLDKDSSIALTSSEDDTPVYYKSNNSIIGLDSSLQPGNSGISSKRVVFGSPQSKYRYLAVDNFGYGYFVSATSTDPAIEIFNDESGAKQAVIISVDYDTSKNEYCVLLSDGSAISYDSNTLVKKTIGAFKGSTAISCSRGVVAVSNLSSPNDGETKRENGEITTIKEGVVVGNLKGEAPITKVEIADNNRVAYLQNNDLILSSMDFTDKNKIAYVSSPDTVHLFTNKKLASVGSESLYVFRDGSLWEIDIDQNVEYRISSSVLFKFISEAEIVGNNYVFSVPIGPNKGTYITSSDDKLVGAWKTATTKTPIRTADYTIMPTISNNKILFTVTVLTPIPSSGDKTYYDISKASAAKQIELIGLDLSMYKVIFN
jgi:hypothetical protein